MKTLKLTDREFKELYDIIDVVMSGYESAQDPDEPDYDEQYAKAMRSLCEKLRNAK